VERRWAGLDRRSLLPAIVVAVIGILLGSILPLIDRAVPVDDIVRAGDRLDLSGGVTVTPPVGWQIITGVRAGATRTGAPDAAVADEGVAASMRLAPFTGDADALLSQVTRNEGTASNRPQFTVSGEPSTVTATGGLTGLAETYTSTSGDGILAAYAVPGGQGLVIEINGTSGQLGAHTPAINAMLSSVAVQEQS
jgi:hypothetical protein